MTPDSASLAEQTFHVAIERLLAFDVDGYAALFADNGVIEWPFAPPDWPRRAVGPEGVREVVGANIARAKAAGRRLVAMHDLVMRTVSDHEVIAEFTVESTASSARLPYVHVLRVDEDGKIVSLRDYFSAATSRIAQENAGVRAFRAFERATMAWDADMLADAFAVDGSMSWPFAPPGFPPIVGRENIRARNRELMAHATRVGRRITRYHDVVEHPQTDGTSAVIELEAERSHADGTLSSLRYIWVIETKDGLITAMRDYFDTGTLTKLVERPAT